MSSTVTINCQNIRLEAVLNENSQRNAVVITHPHPLYGGNMDNHVVLTIEKAFLSQGFSTLRFNFRGTGNSTGMFDNGVGEQEDVLAVLSYLKNQKNFEKIVLAGYSFGSRVNAKVVEKGCEIHDHVMVSPPAGFISYDDILKMPAAGLVITGGQDDIAPPDIVQKHINRWNVTPTFEIIPDCDHFYSSCMETLENIIDQYLENQTY